MLQRIKRWLQVRKQIKVFKREANKAMKTQYHLVDPYFVRESSMGYWARALKPGGAVQAAKMLQKACEADYLPKKEQKKQILKWIRQLKRHAIAAEETRAAEKKAEVMGGKRQEITLEFEEMTQKLLREKGLQS